MKEKARLSQQDAYRSGVILDTSQMLQKAAAPADILTCTAIQLNKLLKGTLPALNNDGAGLKSLFASVSTRPRRGGARPRIPWRN